MDYAVITPHQTYDNNRSIMNLATELKCDDVEALINILDCTSANANQAPARFTEGWASTCPPRNFVHQAAKPLKADTVQADVENEFKGLKTPKKLPNIAVQ